MLFAEDENRQRNHGDYAPDDEVFGNDLLRGLISEGGCPDEVHVLIEEQRLDVPADGEYPGDSQQYFLKDLRQEEEDDCCDDSNQCSVSQKTPAEFFEDHVEFTKVGEKDFRGCKDKERKYRKICSYEKRE